MVILHSVGGQQAILFPMKHYYYTQPPPAYYEQQTAIIGSVPSEYVNAPITLTSAGQITVVG